MVTNIRTACNFRWGAFLGGRGGASGSVVDKALGYKPEDRGFETHRGGILNLPNLSGRTRPWGLLSL
jgi:hypothetical protein